MTELNHTHNFLFSCIAEQKRGGEQFMAEHAFGYMLAGETDFFTPEGTIHSPTGSMGLMKRNQLVKALKTPPPDGGLYKGVNVILDQSFLKQYASENNIQAGEHYKGPGIVEIKPNAFILGFFESLLPYFDQPQQMSPKIATLKMYEAVELLLKYCPQAKAILFDFNDPHKIDLEQFMNKNYTYNVPQAQFAKLTGRSLATFKRDFQKIFATSPERWLLKKRLEHAHFLLETKKQKPTEVYVDSGFENLSHFSTSFKKMFGYSPSAV